MKIMDIIYIPFGYVMKFFCSFTNNNYAISLLLFALLMKLVLLPFSIKQQKNQIKGAALRPKMMAIEKKYAGRNDKATLQKKQNELMELQQKEGSIRRIISSSVASYFSHAGTIVIFPSFIGL